MEAHIERIAHTTVSTIPLAGNKALRHFSPPSAKEPAASPESRIQVSLTWYYAAGLFDYLNASVAAAFTRRMVDMTRPGGMMVIPNFLPSVRDRAYMEAIPRR